MVFSPSIETDRAPVSTAAPSRAATAPSRTRSPGLRPARTTRGGSAATVSATAGALASAGTSSGVLHQTTLSTPPAATVSATDRGPATTAPTGPPRERATAIRLPTVGCSATTIQAFTLTVGSSL